MKSNAGSALKNHKVVSHKEWLKASSQFLTKEKQFTRQRDKLNEQRRNLPWEAVTKDYAFEGPNGKESLADLFEGFRVSNCHGAGAHPPI